MASTTVTSTHQPLFLLVPEVAERLRASASTVRHWIATGRLRAVKAGRRRLVPVDAVDEFVAAETENARLK